MASGGVNLAESGYTGQPNESFQIALLIGVSTWFVGVSYSPPWGHILPNQPAEWDAVWVFFDISMVDGWLI